VTDDRLDTQSQVEYRDLRAARDDALLRRVHEELFLPSFPDPDEQEDPDAWSSRLWDSRPPPEPELHGSVALSRADGAIAGFAFVERYRRSRCALLSYIAIAPTWRRRHLGADLLASALESAQNASQAAGERLEGVFAEVHDPQRVGVADDVIDPRDRLRAMARLGARRVPVDYVQPALGAHQQRSDRLLLIAFPPFGPNDTLDAAVVRAFLREYYEALGVADPEGDPDFLRMSAQLGDATVPLEPLYVRVRTESPVLEFPRFGVALHFVIGNQKPPARSTIEFASFQQDLLSYSYGERHAGSPPFVSSVIGVKPQAQRIELELPSDVRYESEGEQISLRIASSGETPGGPRVRSLRVLASRTDFASGVAVCHLVLVPTDDAARSALSEYDLVLLSKLWQGGEGFDAARELRARWADRTTPVAELAAEVFDHPKLASAPVRVGTIQLVTDKRTRDGTAWSTVFAPIRSACSDEPPEDEQDDSNLGERIEQPDVKGLGGIVQGLIDFNAISSEELIDVFSPLELDDSGLVGIHKGTLLSIAESDRVYEQAAPIGISPYLLLPQAVLLHNEEQLDRAERAFQRFRTRGDIKKSLVRRLRRGNDDAGSVRQEMHQTLAYYLPNVFQYDAERRLLETGTASRGLIERRGQLNDRLAEVSADWEARVARRRGLADDIRNGLLLLLTGIGLHSLVPLRYVMPVFAVAAVLYLAARLRTDA
jgi:ribosomal protein S18 acetylase RimI-like enzyme